jgi:hypothetical protein
MDERAQRAWLNAEADDAYEGFREGAFAHMSHFMEYLASYGFETVTLRMEWDGALEWDILDATVKDEAEAEAS